MSIKQPKSASKLVLVDDGEFIRLVMANAEPQFDRDLAILTVEEADKLFSDLRSALKPYRVELAKKI